jgi:hypothetical protein
MSVMALLDTSFLITLVNRQRPNHETAKQYFAYMLQNGVPMYLSTIAAAEFGIKQAITDLPLGDFRILNFDMTHGQQAARLWNALKSRDEGDSRVAVRDDVKLMAQAEREKIDFILTEDSSTLYKYCERLRSARQIQTCAIALKDGFDASAFNEGRQRDLELP